ncbi:MAG: AAA family ATPase [Gemmataceae bacterium]|nr:AAA family ATPase [Gemmataceae bacterium]
MGTWLVPRVELSSEQLKAVELPAREHWVIGGAPGSGKTQILLHRARHLLDEQGSDPERLRIFVYTNVLKDYIQAALDVLNLPESCVSTFYVWCCEFYRNRVSRSLPRKDKQPDFDAIRKGVLERLRTHPEKKPYDFLLVDEGQDLDPAAFEIMRGVAGHITVCMDHKQQIYEQGSTESQILQGLNLKKRNCALLAAFRCSPYIVELGARLIPDAQQRAEFIRQNKVPMTEKETPLLYLAADFEDEKARMIEVIKTRQAKGERVGILLPQNRQVYGFAQGLTEVGLSVEIRQESWRKNQTLPGLDFTSDLPKLTTYHSAKGLTFDSVILPRLVPSSFDSRGVPVSNVLFVGVTRATKWVFMSTTAGRELPVLGELRALEKEGKLAVKTKDDYFGGSPSHGSNIKEAEKCPKCGKPLKERFGKFGKFFGCSGYPDCDYIKGEEDDLLNLL